MERDRDGHLSDRAIKMMDEKLANNIAGRNRVCPDGFEEKSPKATAQTCCQINAAVKIVNLLADTQSCMDLTDAPVDQMMYLSDFCFFNHSVEAALNTYKKSVEHCGLPVKDKLQVLSSTKLLAQCVKKTFVDEALCEKAMRQVALGFHGMTQKVITAVGTHRMHPFWRKLTTACTNLIKPRKVRWIVVVPAFHRPDFKTSCPHVDKAWCEKNNDFCKGPKPHMPSFSCCRCQKNPDAAKEMLEHKMDEIPGGLCLAALKQYIKGEQTTYPCLGPGPRTCSIDDWKIPCSPGTYRAEFECKVCPVGKYTPHPESKYCKQCIQGTFAHHERATSCHAATLFPTASPTIEPTYLKGKRATRWDSVMNKMIANPPTPWPEAIPLTPAPTPDPSQAPTLQPTTPAPPTPAPSMPPTSAPTPSTIKSCSKMGYYVTAVGVCGLCPAGKYSTGATTFCLSCPNGKFKGLYDDMVQIDGHDASQMSCARCASGKHAPRAGLSACEPCSLMTYADTKGTGKCKACESGKVSTTSRNMCCSFVKYGAFACDGTAPPPCPAGKYDNKFRRCTSCPSGQFSNTHGATNCKECDQSKQYAKLEGQTSCVLCKKPQSHKGKHSKYKHLQALRYGNVDPTRPGCPV
jgi:hypothetical protein